MLTHPASVSTVKLNHQSVIYEDIDRCKITCILGRMYFVKRAIHLIEEH